MADFEAGLTDMLRDAVKNVVEYYRKFGLLEDATIASMELDALRMVLDLVQALEREGVRRRKIDKIIRQAAPGGDHVRRMLHVVEKMDASE